MFFGAGSEVAETNGKIQISIQRKRDKEKEKVGWLLIIVQKIFFPVFGLSSIYAPLIEQQNSYERFKQKFAVGAVVCIRTHCKKILNNNHTLGAS